MTDLVSLASIEDGILLVKMCDQKKQNTFHPAFIDELMQCLAKVAEDTSARACILLGLPEVFCAGAHEDLLHDLAEGKASASDILLPKLILDLPIPTIAAMEGHAVGGGLALGICCDMVIMARGSRYGCSFMNMGFTPGMAITRLLQLAVGDYLANEMMYAGEFIKGKHFEGRGNINYVLPRAQVYSKALSIARRIAEKPRFAIESLKRYLSLPRRQAFEETRTIESFMHQLCFSRPETLENIRENYARPVKGKDDV